MRYDNPPEAMRLRKLDRIAVWNREKIIIAIAMTIWVANVAISIRGKYLLQIMEEPLVILVISQA